MRQPFHKTNSMKKEDKEEFPDRFKTPHDPNKKSIMKKENENEKERLVFVCVNMVSPALLLNEQREYVSFLLTSLDVRSECYQSICKGGIRDS